MVHLFIPFDVIEHHLPLIVLVAPQLHRRKLARFFDPCAAHRIVENDLCGRNRLAIQTIDEQLESAAKILPVLAKFA